MKITPPEVTYVEHMGNDLSVVNAARVSFNKRHGEFEERDTGLIKYLARSNHFMPFCHPHVTLHIKAPIFVARQLAKHQVGGSWSEVSRRYVSSEPEFYIPDQLRLAAENVKQGSSDETVDTPWGVVKVISDALHAYLELIRDGVAPEEARLVLPLCTHTEWVWTGSLQFWARVCNLRLDSHAQVETQEIAQKISEIMSGLFPVSWKELVKECNT